MTSPEEESRLRDTWPSKERMREEAAFGNENHPIQINVTSSAIESRDRKDEKKLPFGREPVFGKNEDPMV